MVKIKLFFFPFAGGTSLIYRPLITSLQTKQNKEKDDEKEEDIWFDFCPIDLPGRLMRPKMEAIQDIRTLADFVIKEIFPKKSPCDEGDEQNFLRCTPFAIFGHSYGAMLAFEVTKKLKEYGMQLPLALFISASRPPSAESLISSTSKLVSEMPIEEVIEYLKSRGSKYDFDQILNIDEVSKFFLQGIAADYKGLETYVRNDEKVCCPLIAIGGDEDCIVSTNDLDAWKCHCEDSSSFDSFVLKGRGHFYLDDKEDSVEQLSGIILNKLKNVDTKPGCNLLIESKDLEMVMDVFSNVLRIDKSQISPKSDLFELGGSSLDTIALVAQIQSKLGCHITQNEFFLNPSVKKLVTRISELRQSLTAVPRLVPIESTEVGGKWFPASPGQEQMLSCWEIAPAMYNMPTTIEFSYAPVSVNTMVKAFTHVVEQQSSLRTIVAVKDGKLCQYVLPTDQAAECFEFQTVRAQTIDEARLIIEKESLFIFPVCKPPIVRGVLVHVQNHDHELSYLLLNQHHVGSDGWSRTVFRRQLLQTYLSILSDEPIENLLNIPKHPNYIDWSLWLDTWLHDHGQQERQLSYWKEKLDGLPALDLPTDNPRPSVLSSNGARLPITIDAELVTQFTKLVTLHGANLYAGLIALYVLMLHRLGGGKDFAIGIALANRHHEGLQNLIGYYANEVAIRAKFRKNMNFSDLLKMVRGNILEGMANADVPFHKVTESLRVRRDSSRTSVFQAMFALQERAWHSIDDLNPVNEELAKFKLKQFNHNTSKFEVHLQLRHDGNGGLEGDLHIATDLFTIDSGERMVQIYKNLMQCCLNSPQTVIGCHHITPESDQEIITKSNDTSKKHERVSLIDQIFCSNTDYESIAFKSDGPTITSHTYGQFLSAMNSFSFYLLNKCHVKYQERIGLLVKNSVRSICGIFGIINVGCAIVVLDPEKTPVERCKLIFDDASVKTVFVDEEFESEFESIRVQGERDLITLDHVLDAKKLSSHSTSLIEKQITVQSNDAFGIFYTSGTTGTPKGAIVTHGNVENLVFWWKSFFDLKCCDRVLLFSSLSFIMSIRQYIPSLCAGSTVVFSKTSLDFEAAIVNCAVNKLICTPSALASLDINKVAPGIDAVQVAGEAPRKATMVEWKSRVHHLYIGLGPTELCAHAVCGEFDGENVCLGYPAANVRAYIVDRDTGLQQPINVPGELWIAGSNVTHGYLNQQELTEKSFGLDPFSTVVGQELRMYKTGDTARRLPDGRIQFIGRGDKQLKVNGFRMEAGEIINAVPPNVQNAHVMVLNELLVMFVMPIVDVDVVKSNLRQKLPTYMVPSKIHSVEQFPLNKNKKLDVPILLSIVGDTCGNGTNEHKLNAELTLSGGEDVQISKSSRVARKIVLIWAQTLGVRADDLNYQSNFFENGGTSLSAVLVSRVMAKEFGVDFSVHDVFSNQTIQSLVEFIQEASGDDEPTGDPNPLIFLPGGETALHPLIFMILQGFGLLSMSIIASVPVIASVSISVRSFIWFGDFGVILFPLFLLLGCLIHISLVLACEWFIIGKYKPGKAKVFSYMFLKWWLVRRVLQITRLYTWALDETVFSGLFLRLLGASVGHNTLVEQPYMLEPDLVTLGDGCVVEFEVQFATSEIKNGILELRKVKVGRNVKIGVRSILLGGTKIHDNSEVAPKSTVDFYTSTTTEQQRLVGSPAKIEETSIICKKWRPQRGPVFSFFQFISLVIMIEIMTGIVYVGVSLGRLFARRYGSIGMFIYLGSLFPIISSILMLTTAVILKRILIPVIIPGHEYRGSWFALRKWFLDRIFLSPVFTYASQRTLQTSSTFPWYMKVLGAKIGKKAWINHPYLRVGSELISINDEFHMGMLTYFSTEKYSSEGISFHPITIGDNVSFGQRCVALGGVSIGNEVTIGAETLLPFNFNANDGATAFGSPPMLFTSTAQYTDIVKQTQDAAMDMLGKRNQRANNDVHIMDAFPIQESKNVLSDIEMSSSVRSSALAGRSKCGGTSDAREEAMPPTARMQDIGTGKYFWLYVLTMILIQGCLPLIIGVAYGGIFLGLQAIFGDLSIEMMLTAFPFIYISGSILLMIFMKVMQVCGGSFSVGTANFFSFRFFYWHIFADMVYLCTSTIIYPFSGTEFYCIWLRFMGAKVGKNVFMSPENGGLREIDFLDVGDNCCLMTPNIHAHYTDHGMLQFCPVKLEDGCEINPGATLMPLTKYERNSRLRPFAVTVKGQHCLANTEYTGNPCKAVKRKSDKVAILFSGQGSQYPGMLDKLKQNHTANEMMQNASQILGLDVENICAITANPKDIQDTNIAQPIVFVANLMAAEFMRQKIPIDCEKIIACAGFSLGELSTLCFAGAITFVDSLKLVKARADAMDSIKGSTMCNIQGLSHDEVKKLQRKFHFYIANVICSHKNDSEIIRNNVFVCSGHTPMIDGLVEHINVYYDSEVGISAKKLKVSAGFHSLLMKPAVAKFQQALNEIKITFPEKYLIYSNVTGRPYRSENEIRKLLPLQIMNVVLWHGTITDMIDNEGISKFIECGPMDVLSKTISLIAPNIPQSSIIASDLTL